MFFSNYFIWKIYFKEEDLSEIINEPDDLIKIIAQTVSENLF